MLVVNKKIFLWYRVLLVSSGGAGCTYLNEQIHKHIQHINPISNLDHLKHLYSPDSHLMHYNEFENIIFVYNDPLSAILSHFRRGWAIMMHKQICHRNDHIDLKHLKSQDAYFDYVRQTKQDKFGIISHAQRWLEYPNCLFVDFRDIKDTEKKISQKLNIPLKLEKKTRHSHSAIKHIPQDIIDIYREFDEQLKNKYINSNIQKVSSYDV